MSIMTIASNFTVWRLVFLRKVAVCSAKYEEQCRKTGSFLRRKVSMVDLTWIVIGSGNNALDALEHFRGVIGRFLFARRIAAAGDVRESTWARTDLRRPSHCRPCCGKYTWRSGFGNTTTLNNQTTFVCYLPKKQ